ncbi:MAG: oxygen-independent coproporphyrinogen III oxidase [Candidatus Tokpelaia sp. JSC189]|nr:MAG: oxygen-independent coproporphyrinogen III oxidase [Candidatus Tokpelaia sp. JSC189]
MTEPFGIYTHWPFCVAKCPYCDFNSHMRLGGVDELRFASAFRREMESLRSRTGRRNVTSIFIGGGTPSLMAPQTITALLDSVYTFWTVSPDVEITMEANPSSVEADRFRAYRAAGVNRLSLGVQALDDVGLKRLGRLHNVAQAFYAVDLARAIFPRLSFDLIYSRPGQDEAAWHKELEKAIDLAADHLSLYQLTIEEGTAFHRLYMAGKLTLPMPETAASMYELTQELTQAHGLPAYEISNHAAAGAQSQHNLLYWRYHQYAGFGPGAHGRFVEGDRRIVTMSERLPERWLENVEHHGHGIIEEEHLSQAQQADEMLLMGLRLCEGLDIARYELITQKSLPQNKIMELQDGGLIEMAGNMRLRATEKGRVLLDYIIGSLAAV